MKYRHTFIKLNILALMLSSVACAPGDEPADEGGQKSSSKTIDTEIPCSGSFCGESKYRSAVPSTNTVKVRFGQSANPNALSAVSPFYQTVDSHVAEINETITDLFSGLEGLAGTEPEVESEDHEWRTSEGGFDEVLDVSTEDDTNFELQFAITPTGEEVAEEDVVMTGSVTIENDEKSSFEFEIDFSAWTAIEPEVDTQGTLTIRATPFDQGIWEVWYDFEDYAEGDESPETSLTTYWVFAADAGALEYIGFIEDTDATVYARWDADGGRYDHYVTYFDDTREETVENISTGCWDSDGAELFSGIAEFDAEDEYEGELVGEESDCDFGPAADRPNQDSTFEDLPQEGEWDELLADADDLDCDNDDPLCFEDGEGDDEGFDDDDDFEDDDFEDDDFDDGF